LATTPLVPTLGGHAILDTLSNLVRSDVAVIVPAVGDRSLLDAVRRIAVETPGKLAVHPESSHAAERQILAGADAVLAADHPNHQARTAGLAMRYGTLPLVPDCAAYQDHVIDFDVDSRTGNGLLYQLGDAYEREAVVLRAAALRANVDVWRPLQTLLMQTAPRWEATAALIESLCLSQPVST
jgi:glycogen synthase